jgi:pyruvate/2-oxoglutarate dehydrogenase complex dihydrolipoamide dehydrogenase (E3) component
MPYDYDMVVIGGGAAGLTAAGMSAVLGAKTALIEARRLGGDCTWYGCIPSKTLLHAARVVHETRNAERRQIISAQIDVDFNRVMELVRQTRQQVYESADAPPNLERLGVTVLQGSRALPKFTQLGIDECCRRDGNDLIAVFCHCDWQSSSR